MHGRTQFRTSARLQTPVGSTFLTVVRRVHECFGQRVEVILHVSSRRFLGDRVLLFKGMLSVVNVDMFGSSCAAENILYVF